MVDRALTVETVATRRHDPMVRRPTAAVTPRHIAPVAEAAVPTAAAVAVALTVVGAGATAAEAVTVVAGIAKSN